MSRPRKFKTPQDLAAAWTTYQTECNNVTVLTHKFNAANSEFVSAELRRAVTCTVEGFCLFAGIVRSAFYQTYDGDVEFSDIVTRIREACENDARMKFELGILPTQLAGLWMSRYGYRLKAAAAVAGTVPLVVSAAQGDYP